MKCWQAVWRRERPGWPLAGGIGAVLLVTWNDYRWLIPLAASIMVGTTLLVGRWGSAWTARAFSKRKEIGPPERPAALNHWEWLLEPAASGLAWLAWGICFLLLRAMLRLSLESAAVAMVNLGSGAWLLLACSRKGRGWFRQSDAPRSRRDWGGSMAFRYLLQINLLNAAVLLGVAAGLQWQAVWIPLLMVGAGALGSGWAGSLMKRSAGGAGIGCACEGLLAGAGVLLLIWLVGGRSVGLAGSWLLGLAVGLGLKFLPDCWSRRKGEARPGGKIAVNFEALLAILAAWLGDVIASWNQPGLGLCGLAVTVLGILATPGVQRRLENRMVSAGIPEGSTARAREGGMGASLLIGLVLLAVMTQKIALESAALSGKIARAGGAIPPWLATDSNLHGLFHGGNPLLLIGIAAGAGLMLLGRRVKGLWLAPVAAVLWGLLFGVRGELGLLIGMLIAAGWSAVWAIRFKAAAGEVPVPTRAVSIQKRPAMGSALLLALATGLVSSAFWLWNSCLK